MNANRVRPNGIRAQQNAFARELEITNIFFPSGTIQPGANVPIEVEVENHSGTNPVFFPGADACSAGQNTCADTCAGSSGLCAVIHAEPEWTSARSSGPGCHCPAAGGSQVKTRTVELPGPGEEGTFNVNIWLELPGTNTTTGVFTRQLTFDAGGATPCSSDLDCGPNFVCEGGECVPDIGNGGGGDGPLGELTMFLAILLVGVVAFKVLSDD